jgi:hypothetical protein
MPTKGVTNGRRREGPLAVPSPRMFSFIKFLTAVGIATFGIWYVFQYNSINEVTGGVAFVSVCRECFLLLKWQPTFGSEQQLQLTGGHCERDLS